MKPDQERVRGIIHNTIISLCENGLKFDKYLRIQGVIGVTTDEQEIFLIHVNESLNAESCTGNPIPGGRPSGAPRRGAAPKGAFARRSSGEAVRARPPFQSSTNSPMGLRGFVRGSPRMNFGSPRMLTGLQHSPAPPYQRTPMKSPRNPLQGMPRLQRFSPKTGSVNPPVPHHFGGKHGLLSLPAPLTNQVPDEPVRTLALKQLFPPGSCRNAGPQFPQIGDVPCKLEKMDVILVDDDDQMEFSGVVGKTEVDKTEPIISPEQSLPDLEPDVFPALLIAPGEEGTINTETDTPVHCEPNVDDLQRPPASVPSCSGVTSEAPDKDEQASERASADNGSLTLFDLPFTIEKPFDPDDCTTEDDYLEDLSFTDPSDEDWKSDEDSMSDPDWSEKSPKRKKLKATPKKTGPPSGSGLTPKQVSNTPSQSRSKLTQKFGRFTQVPQAMLNSGCGGEEDSWKLVARFVCNIAGCNASFSQKYNLLRHQKAKHGISRARQRSASVMMPDLDQADTFEYDPEDSGRQ